MSYIIQRAGMLSEIDLTAEGVSAIDLQNMVKEGMAVNLVAGNVN